MAIVAEARSLACRQHALVSTTVHVKTAAGQMYLRKSSPLTAIPTHARGDVFGACSTDFVISYSSASAPCSIPLVSSTSSSVTLAGTFLISTCMGGGREYNAQRSSDLLFQKGYLHLLIIPPQHIPVTPDDELTCAPRSGSECVRNTQEFPFCEIRCSGMPESQAMVQCRWADEDIIRTEVPLYRLRVCLVG